MTGDGKLHEKVKAQQAIIDAENRKKDKLLLLTMDGDITGKDFKRMCDECNVVIDQAEATIKELEESMASAEEFHKQIKGIRDALGRARQAAQNGIINNDFVNSYIDKIMVTPEDDKTVRLDIKIFTGERTEKYLQKLKRYAGKEENSAETAGNKTSEGENKNGSTGVTFKKMIESYEQNMK